MSFVNSFFNLTRVLRNWASGRTMAGKGFSSISPYYHIHNILSGLLPRTSGIRIRCIMCGFPRSGTHWIRNVIEKSTGQKTYGLHKDRPPKGVEEICLVKIHARNRLIARSKARLFLPRHIFNEKYIYTYRDPRDSMISLYEMYKAKKNLRNLEPQEFMKFYDPVRQYRWEIGAWVTPKHNNVLLVKFENLRLFPVEGFQRIFEYLGFSAQVREEVIDERVAGTDVTKRPRGAVYGWKNASDYYKELIDIVSKELDREIKVLGYGDE